MVRNHLQTPFGRMIYQSDDNSVSLNRNCLKKRFFQSMRDWNGMSRLSGGQIF
jgi:hypothetical protein